MVARLNDLPAAPAFEDAAPALTPGGVCGLHTVYKKSRSSALSALIGGALAEIAEIGAGRAAHHTTTFPGLYSVRKNCQSPRPARRRNLVSCLRR